MSKFDFSQLVETLNNFEYKSNDNKKDADLGSLFDMSLKLRNAIESSDLSANDELIQAAVRTCIKSLENCTRMVNDLELFSANETYDELQTSSIKYLLLPVLLGSLNILLQTKCCAERLKTIELAEVYLKDFLVRCKNYEIASNNLDEMLEQDSKNAKMDPILIRERKIAKLKLKRELDQRLKELKPALERPEAEEYIREYYFVLVEKWILIGLEELNILKIEKEILKSSPNRENIQNPVPQSKMSPKPLKPFIITKNEVQKKIFGLGYPSVPVMTIDDFYNQKFAKVVEQSTNATKSSSKSLQEAATSGEGFTNESEEIEKEQLLEKDDAAALKKARDWDDWKDDNPRGAGNRWNKG